MVVEGALAWVEVEVEVKVEVGVGALFELEVEVEGATGESLIAMLGEIDGCAVRRSSWFSLIL